MRYFFLAYMLMALLSCHSSDLRLSAAERMKIRFDLSQLDEDGLLGPKDGKVALDYEFCIPRDEKHRKEVERIDPSMKVQTARGRIGCGKSQYLCLGNTHQEAYQEVLYRLAQLEYVERIERAFFE